MKFNYLFENQDDTVDIYVKSVNMTYSIPRKTWDRAIEMFDQEYRGSNAIELAKKIAGQLMPSNREDPYREERLWKCLLSHKGKAANKKKTKQEPRDKQQELFDK